ncbi:unnamed protein product, partial [Sphacelaria rigidula]
FKGYCRQTRILLECTSTKASKQISLSERAGRTLAAIVWCVLVDSDLPVFL